MYFLSDYSANLSSANFARRFGSKDKKKRKITIGGGALTGLKYGAGIGALNTLAGTGLNVARNPEARTIIRQNPKLAALAIGLGTGINAIGGGIIGAGIGAGVNAIRKRNQQNR